MSWVRILKKSEKGSITLMVLTAMIFVLVVITASYLAISNKSGNQDRKISKIAQQYRASDEEMEQKYRNTLDNASLTIEQAQSIGMFEKTTNTELVDAYGNQIVVPAGFRITEDATDVTQGLVIEDEEGNQFVWIPVGTVYTNVENTTSNTITLGRYEFAEDGTPSNYLGDYTEDTNQNHNSNYGNAIAKDIDAFKTSANSNHGYYIGRYEAGKKDEKVVHKQGESVYIDVTQIEASELSQNMYHSAKFDSDLMNSYAWDTAILYIQIFSGDIDYSNQIAIQGTPALTGYASDENGNDMRCNIFDMASNNWEWTTETYKNVTTPCVIRGGLYGYTQFYTSNRSNFSNNVGGYFPTFRTILYIKE